MSVVREAASRADCVPTLLAAPGFKAAEPALLEAARRLGLPLVLVQNEAMRVVQPRTLTRSATALRATGFASVAEAAALAAAGTGATLLLPRITGTGATCALAVAP